MRKVFLYLYPIQEYTGIFLLSKGFYERKGIKEPLPVLNECIDKRYRQKGYDIVIAMYADKEIFGIDVKDNDKIVYSDIFFAESCGLDENGHQSFEPRYTNEEYVFDQIGEIDELVVSGYHHADCVKRFGEAALNKGIKTIIDLDLTDIFFSLYRKEGYLDFEKYDPEKFREEVLREYENFELPHANKSFDEQYASPAYGMKVKVKK